MVTLREEIIVKSYGIIITGGRKGKGLGFESGSGVENDLRLEMELELVGRTVVEPSFAS